MKIITTDFHKYDSNWWDKLYQAHTHQESQTEQSNHLDAQKIIGNGSVIDFGCGHGYFSKYVTGNYLGLDWSPEGIKKAKEMNPDKEFIVADALTIKDAREWDFAVAFEIFEHLENPELLVQNMLFHAPIAIFCFPKGEYSEITAKNDAGLLTNVGIHDHDYHYANYYKEDILEMFPNAEIIEKDIDFMVIVRRS
jgi:SAM-dependent methyltransferase